MGREREGERERVSKVFSGEHSKLNRDGGRSRIGLRLKIIELMELLTSKSTFSQKMVLAVGFDSLNKEFVYI